MQQKIEDFNKAEQQGKEIIDYSLKSVQEKFPNVTPTDKEMYHGYIYAYEKATNRMKEDEKNRKREELRLSLVKMWTYQECYDNFITAANAIAQKENFTFVVDEHNKEAIRLLCLYFSNDPAFEQEGIGGVKYSLKKGIWLQSPTRGTGKTNLLRCFCLNKRSSFVYMHVESLRTMYGQGGYDYINDKIGLRECSPTYLNFLQDSMGFMYDEMFDEKHANYMGNPLDISHYIISRLYDQSKGRDWFWKFHITSNYDGQGIEEKCGASVRSRMPEMFNIIKLGGGDRRINRQ